MHVPTGVHTSRPRFPRTIGRHLPEAVARGLEESGIAAADVRSWSVHPGSPRVLTAVNEALGLPVDAIAASRAVFAEHGTMSTATILVILERLVDDDASGPWVAMAFGSGLAAEFALFRPA